MSKTEISQDSFYTNQKFYDDKHYPRGMSRSGEYSLSEVNILETYGIALKELASGARVATTEEEARFIKVCTGELEALSKIERTWKKYQNKVLSPKQFHTLFGRSKVQTGSDNDTADNEPLDLD